MRPPIWAPPLPTLNPKGNDSMDAAFTNVTMSRVPGHFLVIDFPEGLFRGQLVPALPGTQAKEQWLQTMLEGFEVPSAPHRQARDLVRAVASAVYGHEALPPATVARAK